MNQITNIDRYAHQARMLHIQGRVEESIALYKNTIQGLLENSKRYPQYADYYQQYAAILLEEAEAIKKVEAAKRRTTPVEEVKFYLPNEDEEEPQQPSPSYDYSNPYDNQFPPIPSRSQKPTINSQSSDPNTLTKSDIQYAAAGVINQMQQFNNEYHVTEKCKNAYNACATKAKELNERYEISKKAQELGTQIKEWDERNGVSKAVVNGIKNAASAVEGAVKDYADKARNNPDITINDNQRR